MKLFSTTFDDRERTIEINQMVGRTLPFLQKLRMGGTGSQRMRVSETSPDFEFMLNRLTNVNYASLEIRPYGFIFHMVQQGLKSWSWVIPYEEAQISTQNGLTVKAGESFFFVKEEDFLKPHRTFVEKLKKFGGI